MDRKKLLIASASKHEAITQWILNHPLTVPYDLVFLEDLLKVYEIQDELTDHQTFIRWYEKDKLKCSNQSHCLLNRVTFIDSALFEHFKPADRHYAQREFEAYLGFAFNSFQKVQNMALNGLCEHSFSLPQQWCLVKQNTELRIPKYFWGSKSVLEAGHAQLHWFASKNIVHSNIYNLLNWSKSLYGDELTGFCFERPEGEPLFILSLGHARLLSTDLELRSHQLDKIEKILQQIKSTFNFFIFELLLFVEKDHFVFGSINTSIHRSQQHPLFSDFLHAHLVKEFYQCLN